jgi:outer membrane protein TolC
VILSARSADAWMRLAFRAMAGIASTAIVCLPSAHAAFAAEGDAGALINPASLYKAEVVEALPLPADLPCVEEGALTLASLEEMAFASNPSISRAQALVGAARGSWVQVGLQKNPAIGFEGQQIGSGGLAEQHGVVFGQEIVRPGKLRLNRAVASQEILIAEQELATQFERVRTDVHIAYFQVLLAQRQIELGENLRQLSDEGVKATDSLLQAQEGSRGDVLQATLEQETRVFSLRMRGIGT